RPVPPSLRRSHPPPHLSPSTTLFRSLSGSLHPATANGAVTVSGSLHAATTGGAAALSGSLHPATANGAVTVSGSLHAATAGSTADRKSTRLNSSHVSISYAVFCLNKK